MKDTSNASTSSRQTRRHAVAPLKPKPKPTTNSNASSSTSKSKPHATASRQKTDILISIKPFYMDRIVQQLKDHEFRNYLIPNTVCRMWLYVSSPAQTLKYIAVVSAGKRPGEIALGTTGTSKDGNADFNAGSRADCGVFATHAYEILELYELRAPLALKTMQTVYKATFPQKYSYVPQTMLDAIALEEQIRLF